MAIEEFLPLRLPQPPPLELEPASIDAGWFVEVEDESPAQSQRAYPYIRLFDTGPELVICAELPGVGQEDVSVKVSHDLVRISGRRRDRIPHGLVARQSERKPLDFERSIKLFSRVDPAQGSARIENGVLRIQLVKTGERASQRIPIRKV